MKLSVLQPRSIGVDLPIIPSSFRRGQTCSKPARRGRLLRAPRCFLVRSVAKARSPFAWSISTDRIPSRRLRRRPAPAHRKRMRSLAPPPRSPAGPRQRTSAALRAPGLPTRRSDLDVKNGLSGRSTAAPPSSTCGARSRIATSSRGPGSERHPRGANSRRLSNTDEVT